MKKIALLLTLLAFPAFANWWHRSNPGDPTKTGLAITSAGSSNCPGTGCVVLDTADANTVYVSITGTYAATLEFFGSNDGFATTKPIYLFPYNVSTNAVAGPAVQTLVANATGDWVGPTMGFRQIAVYASAFTSQASLAIRLDGDTSSQFDVSWTAGFNGVPTLPRTCDKTVAFTTQSTTAIVKQIAEVAGQNIYICGWILSASTASAGTSITWYSGSGANCGSGSAAAIGGPIITTTPTAAPATPNSSYGPGQPFQMTIAAGDALCTKQNSISNATTLSGTIFYTQN